MKLRSKLFLVLAVAALMLSAVGSALAQRVQFSAPVMVVNTSFLNIRTGPGVQYSVLVTVVGGTTLPVLGVAPDRVWYQVSTVAGVGWINSQFALARGDFRNVPEADAPVLDTTSPTPVPGTGSPRPSGSREWGASNLVDQPLRSQPGNSGSELVFLPADRTVIFTVTGARFADGVSWVAVNVPGIGNGWLEESKVTYRPFACTLTAVEITQNMPLKVGPDGTGGNKDQFIAGGQEAYLLDRVGDLYKIELINGSIGWVEGTAVVVRNENVRSDYCEKGGTDTPAGGPSTPGNAPRAATPYIVVNTGNLNIRSGPGAQYTSVVVVPGGTELPVVGIAPDRVWLLVEGTFGTGWVNSEFVLFRGDGRFLPIVRNAVGQVATPKVSVTQNVILYAAPNLTLGSIGVLNAPVEVDVVARTADGNWVQLNTSLGFGWVQTAFVTVQGDLSSIPVVGN